VNPISNNTASIFPNNSTTELDNNPHIPSLQENLDVLEDKLQGASDTIDNLKPNFADVKECAFSIKETLRSLFETIAESIGSNEIKNGLKAFKCFEECFSAKNKWEKAIHGLNGAKNGVKMLSRFLAPTALKIIETSIDVLIYAVKLAQKHEDKIKETVNKKLNSLKKQFKHTSRRAQVQYKKIYDNFTQSSQKLSNFLQNGSISILGTRLAA
jgi:hypothetical protein